MPSSVGHILAGWAAVRMLGGGGAGSLPYLVAAAAPDVDVAVQLTRKRPIEYGHRRSHSIGAAIAVGALSGGLNWMLGGRVLDGALRGAAAYGSHVLLDYFGKDSEDGLPVLWPFSGRHFASRRPVFRTIYTRRDHFISGLFTQRNLRRVARELAIILPLVAAAELGRLTASRRVG